MSAFVKIDTWEAIPAAISRMQTAGADHRVPVLQALYRGEIAHLEIGRGGSAGTFKRWASAIQLPGLVLIGDDDHAASDGPGTWPIAHRALRWARFVLIHGGTGDASHYEYAIGLAKQYRRLVMVECSSAKIAAWENAASKWCIGGEGLVMRPRRARCIQHRTRRAICIERLVTRRPHEAGVRAAAAGVRQGWRA